MSNDLKEQEIIDIQHEDLTFSRQNFIKRYLNNLNDKKLVSLVMNEFNFPKYFSHKALEITMMNNFSQQMLLRLTSNSMPKFSKTMFGWQDVQLESLGKTKKLFEDLVVCLQSEGSRKDLNQKEKNMECIQILNKSIGDLIDTTQTRYKEIINNEQ